MSLLPRAASATDVVMNNVNPDAAATSGERQPTLLTDADLETSPEKRRKVCFAVCTLLYRPNGYWGGRSGGELLKS